MSRIGGGGSGMYESSEPGRNVFYITGLTGDVPADGKILEGKFVANGTFKYLDKGGAGKTVDAFLYIGPNKKVSK